MSRATARIPGSLLALSALGLALAAGPAAAEPARPEADARGAVVTLVGPPTDALAEACRAIARDVYERPRLRPRLDETAVRVLCGSAAPGDAPREVRALAELREGLGPELDAATNRALVDALASATRAETLVLVDGGAPEHVRVRWLARKGDGPGLVLDPVSLDVPTPTQSSAAPGLFDAIGEGLEGLIAPAAPAPLAEAPAPHAVPGLGPRKSHLGGAKPGQPPDVPAPSFFETPWFWVAAGGVAAIGLTILIVSQATDVGQGSVHVSGKVEP